MAAKEQHVAMIIISMETRGHDQPEFGFLGVVKVFTVLAPPQHRNLYQLKRRISQISVLNIVFVCFTCTKVKSKLHKRLLGTGTDGGKDG